MAVTREELEALGTKELHDRAVRRAEHHVDVKFFWDLLELLPAAQAASGHLPESRGDLYKARALVHDILRADEGDLAEALRPFYVDYLLEHGG